jgi:hypothetical protein
MIISSAAVNEFIVNEPGWRTINHDEIVSFAISSISSLKYILPGSELSSISAPDKSSVEERYLTFQYHYRL